MNDLIIPQFKQNDHSAGIRKGVEGMDAMARGIALPKPERPKQPWWVIPLLIAFLVLVGVVAYSLFKSGRTGWGWAFLVGVGAFLLFLFFILQRLSESSGGSSGGFGGGSSGGGGASGSW